MKTNQHLLEKNYYLGLETSGNICSVAVYEGENLLIYKEILLVKNQNSHLFTLIIKALEYLNITTKALKAVFLSSGPGSYTGLRIGTATAKGLCFANNIPLISLDTLKVMTCQIYHYLNVLLVKNTNTKFILMPILDARKTMVYVAAYRPDLKLVFKTKLIDLKSDIFKNFIQNQNNNFQIILFGSGAKKCQTQYKDKELFSIENIYPQAKYLGKLGLEKYKKQDFVDLSYFQPLYLKNFIPTKGKSKLG